MQINRRPTIKCTGRVNAPAIGAVRCLRTIIQSMRRKPETTRKIVASVEIVTFVAAFG